MKNAFLTLSIAALALASCNRDKEPDNPGPSLNVPATYDTSGYYNNSAPGRQFTSNFAGFISAMREGRNPATTLNASQLEQQYNAGPNSVASAVAPAFAQRLTGSNGYFAQMAAASGKTWTPEDTTGTGGVFDAAANARYLVSATGFEFEEAIQKAIFAAGQYNRFLALTAPAQLKPEEIDEAVASFGAHAEFKNSNDASKHGDKTDRYMAGYAARRDDNSGNGYYRQVADGFKTMKAIAQQGNHWPSEKAAARNKVKTNWEKAAASTAIFYLYDVQGRLSATNFDEPTQAGALHLLAEAAGLVKGWKYVPQADRTITDAQVDDILNTALVGDNAQPHRFINARLKNIDRIQQAIDKIAAVYGFTAADLQNFKRNYVAEQNR